LIVFYDILAESVEVYVLIYHYFINLPSRGGPVSSFLQALLNLVNYLADNLRFSLLHLTIDHYFFDLLMICPKSILDWRVLSRLTGPDDHIVLANDSLLELFKLTFHPWLYDLWLPVVFAQLINH